MNQSDTIDLLVIEWVSALHEINKVTEDSSGHHGKYATLGACLDVVKPVLAERGLALHQYVTESERGVCVRTRIWHESGQWIEDEGLTMPAPADPQKVGGAVTYARRYSLTTFFGITTTDDDAQTATDAMREQPRRQQQRPARASQERSSAPQEPESEPSAAQQVFDALKRYANTPVADSMKAWAEEQGKKLTPSALAADDEWCTQVAERLADTIEAQP